MTEPISNGQTHRPSVLQMLAEAADLSVGLGILALPLLLTALPGLVLFVLLPSLLLVAAAAAPVALAAAVIGPPYLLLRLLHRR